MRLLQLLQLGGLAHIVVVRQLHRLQLALLGDAATTQHRSAVARYGEEGSASVPFAMTQRLLKMKADTRQEPAVTTPLSDSHMDMTTTHENDSATRLEYTKSSISW